MPSFFRCEHSLREVLDPLSFQSRPKCNQRFACRQNVIDKHDVHASKLIAQVALQSHPDWIAHLIQPMYFGLRFHLRSGQCEILQDFAAKVTLQAFGEHDRKKVTA